LEQRLTRGRMIVATHLNDERTRTLLIAEATASQVGLPGAVVADDQPQTLRLLEASRRVNQPPLLAAIDLHDKVVAATPATNLPLAETSPVRQALVGKSTTTTMVQSGAVTILAAAPLRDGNRVVGAVLALQRISDDVLAAAAGDFNAALVVGNQIVAATPFLRTRYTQSHDPPIRISAPPKPGQLGQLTIGTSAFAVATQDLSNGATNPGALLVVGEPVGGDGSLFAARNRLDLAATGIAALLAGVLGWLVGRLVGQSASRLTRSSNHPIDLPPLLAGRELLALAKAMQSERQEVANREAAARAEISRLHMVLDAIGEGIIVSDRDRQVNLTNAAARSLLGLNGAMTSPVFALLPPPDASSEIHTNARVLRTYSAPIEGPTGPVGVVTVLHDATSEHESERLKNEFLSVVSHELQTPLTAIVGAADILLDDDQGRLTSEQSRFLTTIRRNGDRLIGLVNDLLDVTRLESGRVELDRQPVDLAPLIRTSVRALSNLFDQKGQSVLLDLPEGVPPVLGDRRRIEQILSNLLANAGQYTPAKGEIRVSLVRSGDDAVVSVTDNGPGLSPADQVRVFDKFYRGSNAVARRERGSGLGLAIVRSLVELHNGRVWVESTPGRGACFSVSLPIARAEDERE
ncbi:MAG TPA: ATP-binding protein, partial [Chloroflexota bacterium]|nr:ATP-binding protein [Chloroflexota bacterium]